MRKSDFQLSPWNAIYRRDTILKHNIWFAECVQYEDVDWRMRMIYWTENIVRISFPFYCYRNNPSSILHNPSPKLLHDAVACYKRLFLFASDNINPDMREYICAWLIRNVSSFPMLSRIYSIKESRKAVDSVAEAGLLSIKSYKSLYPHIKISRCQKIRIKILRWAPCMLLVPIRIMMLVKHIIMTLLFFCVRGEA